MKIANIFVVISLLSVLMLIIGSVNVGAIPTPYYIGDADLDSNINIKDATAVQKHVAKVIDFTFLQQNVADADEDGEITVKDATLIQKAVAKIEKIDGSVYPYVSYRGFYANYDSGKAMAGVPVTFTANASTYEEISNPLTYEFYVNDELVDKGYENHFTYTFSSAGCYDVKIRCANAFDFYKESGEYQYEVVEPYDSEVPLIKAFYVDRSSFNDYEFHTADSNVTFTAEAIFGAGDYEYAFLLDGKVIRGFSEDNTYTFEDMPDDREEEYILTVRVKDSSTGSDFVSSDYHFRTVY